NLLAPETLRVSEKRLGMAKGRKVRVGIRPENVAVSARGDNGALKASVYVVEPMGAETWVTVELDGERVTGRAAAEYSARSGEAAYLRYDEANVLLFDAATEERID